MKNLLYVMSVAMVTCLAFSIWSCSVEDILETDAELIPYFDLFAEEGAKRGITVDYEAERIEGLLQEITQRDVLGQCFRNIDRPRKVVIDRTEWENSNDARREFLIFHELGHCFLDRGHTDAKDSEGNCVSIMHSAISLCPEFELTEDNRDGFIDELFNI